MTDLLNKNLSEPLLKQFRSSLDGAFYQTWDLDEEGGMVGVVDRQFGYTPESSKRAIEAIDMILDLVSDLPDVSEFLSHFTGDYDPSYDGMQTLEWLILLKSYLQGNKDAFDKVA